MLFLGQGIKNVIFVPFAGITIGWDEYTAKVQTALPDLNVTGIHTIPRDEMASTIQQSDAVIVGGGNTFNLLKNLQEYNLIPVIKDTCGEKGVPYVGWSAGSLVATPEISTTNDMPVVWPETPKAIGLIDLYINAHYSNWVPPHYQGESRDDRLNEAEIVKKWPIVALSEGTGIWGENHSLFIVKSPAEERSPETKLQVRTWLPQDTEPFYRVVDVPTDQPEDRFSLDKYLIPELMP